MKVLFIGSSYFGHIINGWMVLKDKFPKLLLAFYLSHSETIYSSTLKNGLLHNVEVNLNPDQIPLNEFDKIFICVNPPSLKNIIEMMNSSGYSLQLIKQAITDQILNSPDIKYVYKKLLANNTSAELAMVLKPDRKDHLKPWPENEYKKAFLIASEILATLNIKLITHARTLYDSNLIPIEHFYLNACSTDGSIAEDQVKVSVGHLNQAAGIEDIKFFLSLN